ncbi:MAG: FecR domain-containing protein, partial [Thiohalospira sp.]
MSARFIARSRLCSWSLFLALSLLALAALAAEPREVGRVLVASGDVSAERKGESARSLGRGDRLYEGDAITTGSDARAQLRLSDEGLVQLDGGTEYRIQRYREEGEERGAATELVEGGLRTVTGAIGDDNPDDYELDTPVATIGIRGTHFALNHSEDSGTVGEVAQGTIVVENDSGSSEVGSGSFFAVRSRDSAPESLDQRPAELEDDEGPDEEGEDGEDEEGEGQEDEGDGEEGEGDEGQQGDDDEAAGDDEAGGDGDDGLTDRGAETDDDDGFLNDTGDAVYSAAEDVETREELEDAETLWYEDEDLTKVGFTGFLGVSQELPVPGPGDAVDGEEPPDPDFDGVFVAEVDGEGMLQEMVYFYEAYEGEGYDEIRMAAVDGAEPAESGSADALGIHWGRWNLGDYTKEVNSELAINAEGELVNYGVNASHGTDWHWLVLEDADDLMTPDQYDALSETATFAWAGGTEIRATNSEGGAEYTYQVDEFSLTADFGKDEFTDGSLRLVTDDDAPDISLDHVVEEGQALDASFAVSLQEDGGTDSASVMGYFIGEEADGAGVTFSVYTEEDIQGLEGVGA